MLHQYKYLMSHPIQPARIKPDSMKTQATRFEVQINGKRFSNATVNVEDQLEVNLVTLAGQESAVLAITAFIPEAPENGNYVHSANAVLMPGDTVTIALSAAEGPAATGVGPADPELQKESSEGAEISCSFCGKTQYEAGKLIAGADARICNECVVFCHEMISDEN
jgi:hypothetical protein